MLAELNFAGMAAAFVASALVLWLLNPLAHRFDLLDHPAGRKDHQVPTPVIGGVAVFVGCMLAFLAFDSFSPSIASFATASTLLIVVGIYDDKHDLRWYWRILAQVIAALILVYWGGVRIEQLGQLIGVTNTGLGVLSVPFTVFATVGVINAMNMIDGADGLAGLLGLAALLMLSAAAVYAGNAAMANRVILLAGALGGFLIWNIRLPWRPRAHAFLGNAGSAFLGLVIAWVSFRLTQDPGHPVSPVLALWLLPIPVMDCLVLIVRRLREGRSPFAAGQDHIHHLMQAGGFGPTRAAVWLTFFSFACGALAAQAMRMAIPSSLLLIAFLMLCICWYALSARRERAVAFFRLLRRPDIASNSPPSTKAPADNVQP